MYRVIAQGRMVYEGVNKPTATATFQDWQATGAIVNLYHNDNLIISTDVDLEEDEDELVVSGVKIVR